MRLEKDYLPNLAGTLLVAHPGLLDPNFARSIILISAHSPNGSLGVVINRPLHQTIGEFDPSFENSALGSIPLYFGGPIDNDKIILVAWEWLEGRSVFKLYFGITEEKAAALKKEKRNVDVRAFQGYSAWRDSQLEDELEKNAWILSSVKNLAEAAQSDSVWKALIIVEKPELAFLADTPEDPSAN